MLPNAVSYLWEWEVGKQQKIHTHPKIKTHNPNKPQTSSWLFPPSVFVSENISFYRSSYNAYQEIAIDTV